MDRPRHRWLIISGLVLACGLMLLAWHWTSTTEPDIAVARVTTTQPDEPEPPQPESPSGVDVPIAASASNATPAAATPRPQTGTFRGRALDAATRQPIAEFEISLLLPKQGTAREERFTQSFQSETGHFVWKHAPVGAWAMTVSARGYQPFKVAELRIAADKSTRDWVFPLIRGYRLSGRVFDASSGTGLAGAHISLQERSAGPGQRYDSARYERANDDGSFELEGVPGGEVMLTVAAPNHASRDVDVVVDDKTLPVEVGLSTGGTIAGFVVADGKPVDGTLFLRGPYSMGHMRRLDETGAFSFTNRRPGRYVISVNTAAGRAEQEIVLGQDETRSDVLITIAAGRSVRGTITGLRPEQLEQLFVTLRSESKAGGFSAGVDAQGAYTLAGVPPGQARLTVFGGGLSRQLHRSVEVPADEDLVLDIAFPPGSRLSGRVTEGGKPAPRKIVWMTLVGSQDSTYQTHTVEDGRYEIEGLVAGEYRLRADGDVTRDITIAGDATLDIDIPSVQIAGRVIEDGSAVPIVGANVFVRGSEAATARVRGFRETDHFGHFELTGVEPGEIMFTVYKAGYEMHRERLTYAAPIPNQTIRLRRSPGVQIKVHPAAGGELPRGVSLSEKIADKEADDYLWIPVNSEGIGSLPSALAGSTFVIHAASERILIKAWDGQSLDVRLGRGRDP